MRDVFGNVLRPALGGVEGDDADWIGVLAGEQVLNDRFQIGGFDSRLSAQARPCLPKSSATR